MKSQKQLKKEVQDLIAQCLQEVRKEDQTQKPKSSIKTKKTKPIKTIDSYDYFEEMLLNEKESVSNMTDAQLAGWLIEKHVSFVEMISHISNRDFINERTYDDRCTMLMYMDQLNTTLFVYEIDYLNEEVISILEEKDQIELLSILNTLNYL